jgi:hypothetical protein
MLWLNRLGGSGGSLSCNQAAVVPARRTPSRLALVVPDQVSNGWQM